jgi:NADPH:quinone reductase-like Zn-dependent oxidoreductase
VQLDSTKMKASDVFVKMVAAPITPVDLAQVTGFAGKAPAFPRVGGNEGVGIVEDAGASSGLKKGDVVVASKGGVGA